MDYLNRDQLETGGIYEIRSRNLVVGTYNSNDGFIGIREKFGDEYLFTEYLARERGGTQIGVDTVHPVRLLGTVPGDIAVRQRGEVDSQCGNCGKLAWWTGPPAPAPWDCDGDCEETSPQATQNELLFDLLKTYEDKLRLENNEDQS
jgi:hypothetical protein